MARRKKDEANNAEEPIVVPELNKDDFVRNSRPDSEPIKAEVKPRRESVHKDLYWLGALPAIGSFKFQVNAGDEIEPKIIETTAFDLWNNPDLNERRWVGKCPIFQNIPVGRETFPAYTDMVTRQTGGVLAFNPYPGMVRALSRQELEKLIYNCTERFMVREDGAERRLVDLDAGQLPKLPEGVVVTPEMISGAEAQREYYNERTDRAVAEFVYLYKLKGIDVATPPSQYYTLVPHMDEVLKNPPEPLAALVTASA